MAEAGAVTAKVELPSEEISMPKSARWPLLAGVVGLLGWVGTIVLGLGEPSRFYHSYLVACCMIPQPCGAVPPWLFARAASCSVFLEAARSHWSAQPR